MMVSKPEMADSALEKLIAGISGLTLGVTQIEPSPHSALEASPHSALEASPHSALEASLPSHSALEASLPCFSVSKAVTQKPQTPQHSDTQACRDSIPMKTTKSNTTISLLKHDPSWELAYYSSKPTATNFLFFASSGHCIPAMFELSNRRNHFKLLPSPRLKVHRPLLLHFMVIRSPHTHHHTYYIHQTNPHHTLSIHSLTLSFHNSFNQPSSNSLFFFIFSFTPTMEDKQLPSPGPKHLNMKELEECFSKTLALPGSRICSSIISGNLLEAVLRESKNVLAFRFIADPKWSLAKIRELLPSIWSVKEGVDIHFVGDLTSKNFLFVVIFEDEEDLKTVVRRQPWVVNGVLLLMEGYNPLVDIKSIKFASTFVWLQVHYLPPLIVRCKEIVLHVAKAAGDVLPNTYANFGGYARLKVIIDHQKPLVAGSLVDFPSFGKKNHHLSL